MVRFIVRRLIAMVGWCSWLSVLLFFWLRALPGGTVSAILGERATASRRAALEAALGLDQPIYVQYLAVRLSARPRASSASRPQVLPGDDALEIFLAAPAGHPRARDLRAC